MKNIILESSFFLDKNFTFNTVFMSLWFLGFLRRKKASEYYASKFLGLSKCRIGELPLFTSLKRRKFKRVI